MARRRLARGAAISLVVSPQSAEAPPPSSEPALPEARSRRSPEEILAQLDRIEAQNLEILALLRARPAAPPAPVGDSPPGPAALAQRVRSRVRLHVDGELHVWLGEGAGWGRYFSSPSTLGSADLESLREQVRLVDDVAHIWTETGWKPHRGPLTPTLGYLLGLSAADRRRLTAAATTTPLLHSCPAVRKAE